MNTDLGPLTVTRRDADEPIRAEGDRAGRLGDFWSWACSDLANNSPATRPEMLRHRGMK